MDGRGDGLVIRPEQHGQANMKDDAHEYLDLMSVPINNKELEVRKRTFENLQLSRSRCVNRKKEPEHKRAVQSYSPTLWSLRQGQLD